MKTEQMIREMMKQCEFDNEADKTYMEHLNSSRIKSREDWIKCLGWVLEDGKITNGRK